MPIYGRWGVFLLLLLFVSAAGPVRASGVLQLSGTEFPLILEQDAEGVPAGLAVDILEQVERRLGLEIQITILPFPRMMRAVREQKTDGAIGLYKTAERQKYLHYTRHAFYEDRLVVATIPGGLPGWDGTLKSLRGHSLLYISSWAYGDNFDQERANLTLKKIITAEQAQKVVLAGRADGALLNQRNVEVYRRRFPQQGGLTVLFPPIWQHQGFFTLTRQNVSRDMFGRFDAIVTELVRAGMIGSLNRHYGLDFDPKIKTSGQ